jgi:hypothetical protein
MGIGASLLGPFGGVSELSIGFFIKYNSLLKDIALFWLFVLVVVWNQGNSHCLDTTSYLIGLPDPIVLFLSNQNSVCIQT